MEQLKAHWIELDQQMNELKQSFVNKVKRNALTHSEHDLMNKRYFRIKADMDRCVALGKQIKKES